jgi:hypothetical protein
LGTFLAYDEAMYGGDPILADALWRYSFFISTIFSLSLSMNLRNDNLMFSKCTTQQSKCTSLILGLWIQKFIEYGHEIHVVSEIGKNH